MNHPEGTIACSSGPLVGVIKEECDSALVTNFMSVAFIYGTRWMNHFMYFSGFTQIYKQYILVSDCDSF